MPEWLDKFYDKVLIPAFGGTYSSDAPQQQSHSARHNPDDVAMDTFRRRASSTHGSYLAPGFDYTHWKPYGKRRLRHYPNEYALRCRSLASYVKATAYAGHVGLEERRWAGEGIQEPVPLGAKGSMPGSIQGSRDILSKMGPAPGLQLK